MKVLLMSDGGDGTSLAVQLAREDHTVDMWIHDPLQRKILSGIVNRVESWRPAVARADLVVCDGVGMGDKQEMLQKMGKPCLGFSPFADVIEIDRQRGMQLAKKVGMSLPETIHCSSVEEARKIKWESEFGYVIKPIGELSTGTTYVCPDPSLYEWALGEFKPSQEFIIQAVIDPSNSIEVSTEGWFNGSDWVTPFNHTWEEKRFMVGGLGMMTGCMGNIVLPVKTPDRLVKESIMLLSPVLKKMAYRGPIDVNCLVTKEKAYVLEFTPRFGYDAIDALIGGLSSPLGSLLFETATGVAKSMSFHSWDYLMAVRVSTPPYPVEDKEIVKKMEHVDVPIVGVEEIGKDLYPAGMYKKGVEYLSAGGYGTVCKVVSHGRDVREAQRRCYDKVRKLKTVDIQYRTDIGSRVEKDVSRLKQWGWLNG